MNFMDFRWMMLPLLLLCFSCTEEAIVDEDIVDNFGAADTAFSSESMHLSGGFDGSQRFGMWAKTMEFTRRIERDYGKSLRWVYFINTCYFVADSSHECSDMDNTSRGAGSAEEAIVRTAFAQQAINEGHEIANHSARHLHGEEWSVSRWREDFEQFHSVVDRSLFEPVFEIDGSRQEFVFPRWEAAPEASVGEVGASCQSDGDCHSGTCLPISATASFCSAQCNRHTPCENGTICGTPLWNSSTDACVPMPVFPVEYEGEIMFDENGAANLNHPRLRPYRILGHRAPYLGQNAAFYDVLTEFNYVYDTSQVISMGPPALTMREGRTFPSIYQLGLMKGPGALTIPMDYNYKVNDGSGARMLQDYQNAIMHAHNERNRMPWNIGHHFALSWMDGAYWQAMQDTFEFAAQGCPSNGSQQCSNVQFTTFRDLVARLRGMNDDSSDSSGMDNMFQYVYENEGLDNTQLNHHGECGEDQQCEE